MRKLIISALFICLILANNAFSSDDKTVNLYQEQTSFSIHSESPEVLSINNSLSGIEFKEVKTKAGVFSKIIIEGYTNNHKPGYPELPVLSMIIEVPYGAEISFKIVGFEKELVDLNSVGITSKIAPSQPPVSKSTDPDKINYIYNEAVYNSDKTISSDPVKVEYIGKMRGRQLARLTLSPFSYNPVQNVLEVLNGLEVEIKFENADFALTQELREKYYSPYFENDFENILGYQIEQSKDSLTRYPVKMVIVSDPMFQTNLQPYVEWKTKKGFTVIVAYTNNPQVGNTTTSIKNYLQGLYNAGTPSDPAPTFIVFAGDVAQVPTFQAGGHVSDLYYCEYDGGGDYLPEVYYGRFSAVNPEQLDAQLNKTLEYEQYTFPDETFLDEVVMIAGVDANYAPIHGNGHINYGTDNYFNPAHGLTSHTYLYPASGNASSQIIQHVSNGAGYVNYTAHGFSGGWADPSFHTSDIAGLQNAHKYPLMVGNCCLTSTFDDPECFGEALLRANQKGAIGYIGASNSTYWDEDYYFGVGVGPIVLNPTYAQTSLGAFDCTFHDHGEPQSKWYPTQAQMMFAGNLAVTAGAPSNAQYYWEIYHLMGDPSLMIYFSVPAPLNASHLASIPVGMNTLQVTTEPGAYVAISFNGSLLDAQLVDSSGMVNLVFTPMANVGIADVVATKQNREPYIGTVNVIPGNTPFVIYKSHSIDDSKGNSNGKADYDEDILLDTDLENVGSQVAYGVQATISTNDPYITLIDNSEVWGDIAGSSSLTKNGAFEFSTSDDIPDQHMVGFDIDITDNSGGNWNSVFNVTVNAPALEIGSIAISDVAGGNGDGVVDPGETIEITIECKNNGHSDALTSVAVLNTTSVNANIINSSVALGTIPNSNLTYATYNVEVDASAPLGSAIDFDFNLNSGKYGAQHDFILKVGIIAEDFETGDFLKFPWNTLGNKPWFISTNDPFEGTYCSQSGDISGNQLSIMVISMDVVVDDSISFFRKVSSEFDYDFLQFYVDNQLQEQWSGEEAWARVAYPVSAGVHSFKWSYEKDFWASAGDDCGWIDFIVFPPVSVSTSTEDLSGGEEMNFNVYPNPFSNTINIKLSGIKKEYKLSLYNSIGQVLKVITQKDNSSLIGDGLVEMDLHELKPGAYYLKLESDVNVIVRKVIKS